MNSVYLAGLWTVGVKLHLFNRQLSASVGIITEEDASERSLTQKFPQTPICWSPRSCWRGENSTLLYLHIKQNDDDTSSILLLCLLKGPQPLKSMYFYS